MGVETPGIEGGSAGVRTPGFGGVGTGWELRNCGAQMPCLGTATLQVGRGAQPQVYARAEVMGLAGTRKVKQGDALHREGLEISCLSPGLLSCRKSNAVSQ